MEKVEVFTNEKKRDRAIQGFIAKGFCTHTYRYVYWGVYIYCIKYWK